MKLKFQIGAWVFEVTGITARKVQKYGDEYSAIATIKIVNGQLHIEGLLNNGPDLNKSDYLSLYKLLRHCGLSEITYTRFKRGIPKLIKKEPSNE